MSASYFVVSNMYGIPDCWCWGLYHSNGTLIARSREYSRKSDAKRAIKRLLELNLVEADVREEAYSN